MDLTMIGTALHYVLAFEFLLIVIVGAAVTLHALSVDFKVRRFSAIQQEMLNGIYEGWKKASDDKEALRQARLNAALG